MALPNNRNYYGNYSLEELLCMCNNKGIKSFENRNGELIITCHNGDRFSCYIQDSGSGGGGCCYTAGDGIDISDGVISTNASMVEITRNIVVNGNIGAYHDGDVISEGTSIQEILNNILKKTYDVIPVLPTVEIALQNVDAGETYEVGTYVGEIIVNSNYTDGEFVGEEGYEYSIDAECEPMRYYFQMNGGTEYSQGSDTYAYPVEYIPEGVIRFSTHVEYSSNEAEPERSDGTTSNVSIDAGDTGVVEATVRGAYKYYYGCIDTSSLYRYIDENGDTVEYPISITTQSALMSLGLEEGFCEGDGPTTIDSIQSGDFGKNSIILVLPHGHNNILSTENEIGASVDIERWELSGDGIPYENGNMNTMYHVYVLHSLLPVKYNNIKFI